MGDYSTQEPGKKVGRHASTIDLASFREFMVETDDFDMMLEVKDKEKSAIKAILLLKEIGRVQ